MCVYEAKSQKLRIQDGVGGYSYVPNKRGVSNNRGGWILYQILIKGERLLKGEGGFSSLQI